MSDVARLDPSFVHKIYCHLHDTEARIDAGVRQSIGYVADLPEMMRRTVGDSEHAVGCGGSVSRLRFIRSSSHDTSTDAVKDRSCSLSRQLIRARPNPGVKRVTGAAAGAGAAVEPSRQLNNNKNETVIVLLNFSDKTSRLKWFTHVIKFFVPLPFVFNTRRTDQVTLKKNFTGVFEFFFKVLSFFRSNEIC